LDNCPLCIGENKVIIRLKPYTAGVRCLVFDGYNANDFPTLKAIKNRLLKISVDEHFDVVNRSGLGLSDVITL
jgi:hypothetical protein